MSLYYFHLEDDTTILDQDGVDLPDLKAAHDEAIETTADMLHEGKTDTFWSGTPWRMWVTDQPGGVGKTLFALHLTATGAA